VLYCRVLGVSPQGYNKYLANQARPYKYTALLADIQAVLEEDRFNANYGKRRMYEKLKLDYSRPECYNTVAKVMRDNSLLHEPNKCKGLTKADKLAQKSDNLLKRDFTAEKPNEKTVTDIKEWPGSDGKVYSSAVFDCYDNSCLGLGLAGNMEKELAIEAFNQAGGPYPLSGAIAHSDRGSQYTSEAFREALKKLKMVQSMNGAAGRCHDNAKCESMWARGQCEVTAVYDLKKLTCEEIKRLLFYYYMVYWNNSRICSAIGGVPPAVKRGAYYEKLADRSGLAA